MSDDLKALKDKLAQLAATDDVYENGGRVLAVEGSVNRLKAILSEIDDTVLSTALTFKIGDRHVSVNAGGRRLMGISSLSDELGAVGAATVGKTLAADDSTLMEQVAAVMTSFSEAEGVLTIRSEPAEKLGGTSDVGPKAGQLRKLWLDEIELPDGSPMTQFLILTEGKWAACVHITNDVTTQATGADGETAELTDMLGTQFAAFAEARAARVKGHSDPSLTIWIDAQDPTRALGVARHDDEVGGFVCAVNETTQMIKNWSLVA